MELLDDEACPLTCRYESTSSDDSSSDSSEEGSDSSEYHEAREKLPESTIQHQQLTHSTVSQCSDSNTVPHQTAVKPPAAIPDSQAGPNQTASAEARLPDKPHQSPATDSVLKNCASDSTLTPASNETVNQPTEKHAVTQEITSSRTESTPAQSSIISSVNCSSLETVKKTKQQNTVQSETAVHSSQVEQKPAAESSAGGAVTAKQVR